MPLAISSYLAAGSLTDSEDELNLGWTSDERDCLGIDLPALVTAELETEIRSGLESVHSYLVADPYAERVFASAVASYYSLASTPRVTCGAGVGSLLHGLARLAAGQRVGIAGHIYPDFPFWVSRSGGQCSAWHPDRAGDEPGIIFTERPRLLGDQLDLPALRHLGQQAMARGAVVLVDESNANYWPPSFSAVNLVCDLPNLVVIRGLAKAYGLGGLRLSYCVTSDRQATELVRSAVPPLLASSLSLRVGKQVLLAGDITAPLRGRIVTAKKQTLALMRRAGLRAARSSPGFLPYVFLSGADDAQVAQTRGQLEAAGIKGKDHLFWLEAGEGEAGGGEAGGGAAASAAEDDAGHLYRLSTPLTPARMRTLALRLAAVPTAV